MTTKIPIVIAVVLALLLTAVGYFSYKTLPKNHMSEETKTNDIEINFSDLRPMAVAGSFYPADAKKLSEMTDAFFAQAVSNNEPNSIRIIIAPHAGYEYSGAVAASAFKQVNNEINRVVIIGRSHQAYFDQVAADDHDGWQTPLGNLAVDSDFLNQLIKDDKEIVFNRAIHANEHSLEVMLPFIIKKFGLQTKIVPLLFGNEDTLVEKKLAEALAKNIDDKTLIVVSTDLSHYPTPENARLLDQQTIKAILINDTDSFHQKLDEIMTTNPDKAETLACGETAVGSALFLSKILNLSSLLIQYANSNDAHPESSTNVVGYAAIIFNEKNMRQANGENLNAQEKQTALSIARDALEAYFSNNKYQLPENLPEIFNEKRGVFVTLKKSDNLRGCIGLFESSKNLADNIAEMALAAALDDHRFIPVTGSELDEIEIEISVLSPMKKIFEDNEIKMGEDGVYIRRGNHSGVFLPQVAEETDWDKETFLNSLCTEKAGLEAGCWREPNTEMFTFTAQVFSE